MPVSAVVPRIQYTAPGGAASYTVTFKFYQASDLVVITTDGDGVDTTRVLDVDYTVTGGANSEGLPQTGSIDASFASGDIVTIYRELAMTQETEFTDGGSLPARSLNGVADRLTMLVQQVAASVGRVVKLGISSPLSELIWPEPVADRMIGWNAAGDALENKNLPTGTAVYASIPNTLAGLSTNEAVTPAGLAAYVEDLDLGSAAVLDAGTGANELVQLDGTGKLPALDGSQLTGLAGGDPLFRYFYFGG